MDTEKLHQDLHVPKALNEFGPYPILQPFGHNIFIKNMPEEKIFTLEDTYEKYIFEDRQPIYITARNIATKIHKHHPLTVETTDDMATRYLTYLEKMQVTKYKTSNFAKVATFKKMFIEGYVATIHIPDSDEELTVIKNLPVDPMFLKVVYTQRKLPNGKLEIIPLTPRKYPVFPITARHKCKVKHIEFTDHETMIVEKLDEETKKELNCITEELDRQIKDHFEEAYEPLYYEADRLLTAVTTSPETTLRDLLHDALSDKWNKETRKKIWLKEQTSNV